MIENYKIIGGDGVEYGPATLDELQSWIRDGRVGKDTLVWHADTSAWSPASRYAELETALRDLYGIKNSTVPTTHPAGFGLRFLAYVIDHVILALVLSLLWPFASEAFNLPPVPVANFSNLEEFMKPLEEWSTAAAIFLLPCHALYHVFFNGTFGATPGKLMVGVRIVTLEGARIGYGLAILRWMGQRLSELPWFLGYLFVFFRADKRALHDLMARTQVVFKQ